MGVAFGYAYAGSVSMLTETFSDIRGVMMLGHSLTVLTILMLIKPTLLTTINTQPAPLGEVKPKSKEEKDESEPSDDASENDDSQEGKKEEIEESAEDEPWQEEAVDWEQPPDAIGSEVDWDEEEEVSENESDEGETEVIEPAENNDIEPIENDDDVELIEDDVED